MGAFMIGGIKMPQRDGTPWGETEKEYQAFVYNHFKSLGYPEKTIFGIMGNASQESDWQPWQNESGGTAYGLWQWDGSRKTSLQAYGTDLTHQCDFLHSELTGENTATTGATYNWINNNGYNHDNFINGSYSSADSASAFCWCWERPNASLANEAYRRSEAEAFEAEYGGGSQPDYGAQVENAVQWMINIANDDTHGYDQDNRWSPDYDCSSFVISGYEQAGIPLKTNGATYTGDMKQVALDTGFHVVDWGNDPTKLVRGDIILNEVHHVCCYIGDGKIVQASANENGGAHGGQTGDQTGTEIYIRDYYVYSSGWDCVLRFHDGATGGGTNPQAGEVWNKIIATPYKVNQLSAEQTTFLKTLAIGSNVKLKFTFNHNKRQIGQNYLGNKLTFDNKEYKIKDVRNDGYIIVSYGGSVYYKYVNPKYITSIS